MNKVPVMKAEETTSGGRVYTFESIKFAMDKIKWDSKVPLVSTDRDGNKKEVAYFEKSDFELNEEDKTLYIILNEDTKFKVMNATLVPVIYVDQVRRIDDKTAAILAFTLNGIEATADLCSFPSINATVAPN